MVSLTVNGDLREFDGDAQLGPPQDTGSWPGALILGLGAGATLADNVAHCAVGVRGGRGGLGMPQHEAKGMRRMVIPITVR